VTFAFDELVRRKLEVPKYNGFSLLADAGGYLGLLLGLSIWSVFKSLKSSLLIFLKREK